ncbi:hypothetical protein O1611_g2609 [Lasiodiplodia mahajangana]|uniref:Uncharacterized protein n=1 Tax=Lasiodiplodia mahajangana TaxID=1108764 RepID=A0ACC2JUT9_9PEZI|nr:hypothetical protein O1611_g2609 [Lasiodiplodia mahajangana]
MPSDPLAIEKAPFLDAEDALESDTEATRFGKGTKASIREGYIWLGHCALVLVYTSIFIVILFTRTQPSSPNGSLLWSPAQEAIKWETRVIDAIPGSTPYTGYPSPQSDEAWGELLEGISVKILPHEMERLGYSSLKLKDGSGYVGSLGVYHELHCIKRVRKMIYRDYYYPNMTTDEWHHRMGHIEHCLEQIRQSAICHGDVNIIAFSWLQDPEHNTTVPTMQFGSQHQCINWDKLNRWAKARRLDLFDEELLAPPPRVGMSPNDANQK